MDNRAGHYTSMCTLDYRLTRDNDGQALEQSYGSYRSSGYYSVYASCRDNESLPISPSKQKETRDGFQRPSSVDKMRKKRKPRHC